MSGFIARVPIVAGTTAIYGDICIVCNQALHLRVAPLPSGCKCEMLQYNTNTCIAICTRICIRIYICPACATLPRACFFFVRFEILYEGTGFEEVPLDETNLLVSDLSCMDVFCTAKCIM